MKTEFIPDLHIYLIDGREVPSPNEVLDDLGFKPNLDAEVNIVKYMDFGKQVHKALEQWDKTGKPPENQEIKPYLNAYCAAKAELGFQVLKIEEPEYNDVHLMACTPDRVVRMPTGKIACLELKSGAEAAFHRYQVSWQAICVGGNPLPLRLCLYLEPDKYRLKEFKDWKDFDITLAIRAAWGAKYGR